MSGYPIELEDREYLKTLENEVRVLAVRGTYTEVRLDPRVLIQTENQLRQGSCAGHSLSSTMEWNYAVATGGKQIELSRAMAYYEVQRIDKIRGDGGSTVGGGEQLSKKVGLCREELWKYPKSYDPTRPPDWDAVITDAANYKIGTSVRITSYEGYRTFLGAGLGGIHQGIAWNDTMNRAVVENFRPGGGGHSICALCLSERVDSQGNPYAWILNSWGQSFGNGKGWQEWSPTAIRQMLAHRFTVFIGLSDMPNMTPRSYSLEDWKKVLTA
jgi:hypothetical protein